MSNSMLAIPGNNLNELSYMASGKLLKKVLELGYPVKRIMLDQLGPPARHVAEMRKLCGSLIQETTQIVSESKADDKYPIVSAASIIAKVTRDQLLNEWEFPEEKASQGQLKIGREWGCGYPSDPHTKKWLRDQFDPVFGFTDIVRFSWSTARNLLEENKAQIEWKDPKPEESGAKGNKKLTKMFKEVATENNRAKLNKCVKQTQLKRQFDL